MDNARKELVEQVRTQRSRFEKLKLAKTQHNQIQQSPTPPEADSTHILRETRLDTLGPAPWGAHFCLLYENKQDLIDVLVPYFKAGLENNELCIWITGPLSRKEALEALKRTVPDFKEFQRKHQIEIITHADWYLKDNTFNPKIILENWVQKLNYARTKGFNGMRVTGDGSVFEERDLKALAEYEKQVNQTIGNTRIIAICTYQPDKCSAVGLVDVISNHQSAIVKRQGKWEVVENTGHKKAQEALRASEEKYRQVVSTTTDAIMLFDPETKKIIEVNPTCEKLYGYTREEFLNLTQTEISAEPQKSDVSIKKIAKGQLLEIDLRYHRKKDGTVFPVEISGSTFELDGKRVVCGVVRDITERKKIEEALRQERTLLSTLIDNIPDSVYVKDTQGRFLLGNKELASRFNLENTWEFMGKTDYDFFDKEQADRCYEHEQKVINSGESLLNYQEKVVRPDGTKRWLQTSKVPLKDNHGKVTGLVGIARDITERKNAELNLVKNQIRLKALASQLTLAEESERRRIAGELHDRVCQSLAFSKIKIETFRKYATSPEIDKAMEEVAQLLGQVIRDTRNLTFDLSSPILYEKGFEAAVAEWLEEEIERKHKIRTVFQDDEQPKPITDDIKVLMFRNVRELLINVAKHSNATEVKVGIRKVASRIEVTVKDNGIGFDPIHTAKMSARNASFGLFSIRERLEELGGQLEIDSEPGQGCKITMTAPLEAKKVFKE